MFFRSVLTAFLAFVTSAEQVCEAEEIFMLQYRRMENNYEDTVSNTFCSDDGSTYSTESDAYIACNNKARCGGIYKPYPDISTYYNCVGVQTASGIGIQTASSIGSWILPKQGYARALLQQEQDEHQAEHRVEPFFQVGPPRKHEPYKLFTGWVKYRLGDVFQYQRGDAIKLAKQWPTSIANQYARATGARGDYQVLLSVIRARHRRDALLPEDIVVVHLRVGDVLERNMSYLGNTSSYKRDVIAKLGSGTLSSHEMKLFQGYVKPVSYFEGKLALIPSNVTRAILVVASHHNLTTFPRSSQYIDIIHSLFASKGFAVGLRIGKNPDDDVEFVSRARYFIPGGGGYARIMANVVRAAGGKVL